MLNQFINSGADEELIKSLPTEGIPEHFIKSMNRAGLVQKQVTVHGKNGDYQAMKWVRTTDDKADVGVVKVKTMTEAEFKKKYPNGYMQNPEDCLKNNGSNATWHGEKLQNPSVMKKAKEEYAQFKKDKEAMIADTKSKSNVAVGTVLAVRKGSETISVKVSAVQSDSLGDTVYEVKSNDLSGVTKTMKVYPRDIVKVMSEPKTSTDTKTESRGQGFIKYNGETIKRVQKHGQTYYQIEGDRTLYSYEKDAKKAVDEMPGKLTDGAFKDKDGNIHVNVTKDDFVKDVVANYDSMSRGDLQAAVEAFALANKLDDDKLLAEIDGEANKSSDNSDVTKEIKDVFAQKLHMPIPKSVEQAKAMLDDYKSKGYTSNASKNAISEAEKVLGISSDDSVKFDKTKSGKVGGIQVGKELAAVVKTAPTGAKKLREVTDNDTGKTYSIYTDTSSNKPDGIVAVENTSSEPKKEEKKPEAKPSTDSKMSKADAKAKTQSYTSKIGKTDAERSAFMDKVKAAGITWKENDKPGINWMRCCMAMNSHFENGGTFDDSAKAETKKEEPKTENEEPVKLVNPSAQDVDKALTKKFPYDNKTDYTTIGNVDYEFPGNGKDSGQMQVAVHHISDTNKVTEYLRSIGASNINTEKVRNKWGNYDVLKFDFDDTKPTHDKPLVTTNTKSGKPYQIWEDNGRIYGSLPGQQNSHDARAVKDFTSAGFDNLDEVKDYIKKYF